MHSSIVIVALLGAGVFAHPHAVHNHKREVIDFTSAGHAYEEDITYVTLTEVAGSQPSPPAAKQDNAMPGGWQQPQQQDPQPPAAPTTSSSQAPPSSTPQPPPAPASSSQPVATSTAASSSGGSGGSPMSPAKGGTKSLLQSANQWRKAAQPNAPDFSWSTMLAGNAQKCATTPTTNLTGTDGQVVPQNEGGANVMGHMLYPGTMGQCITEGDDSKSSNGGENLTPFDLAMVAWLCEKPNSALPCGQMFAATGMHYFLDSSTHQNETGHADIILNSDYKQIGCYYMDSTKKQSFTGMWTCDFAP